MSAAAEQLGIDAALRARDLILASKDLQGGDWIRIVNAELAKLDDEASKLAFVRCLNSDAPAEAEALMRMLLDRARE